MARTVILLVLVVAIAYATAYPQQPEIQECGPNEVFTTCGSACVDTCAKKASPICTMNCKIGCQCKPGFVKNHEDKCVLTRDC